MVSCYIYKKNTSTLCSSKWEEPLHCYFHSNQSKTKAEQCTAQCQIPVAHDRLYSRGLGAGTCLALPSTAQLWAPYGFTSPQFQTPPTILLNPTWSGYHSNTQLLVPVSVWRSRLLWKNTTTISSLGRKEFILLILPYNSRPLKDIRAGTPGRNLYAETETNHGECYLLAYYLACWAGLPIAPRTTCLGGAPLLVNWALPYQSSFNKMHHRLVHRPVWCAFS